MTYKSLDERINSVAGKVVYLGDQLGRGSGPIKNKLIPYTVFTSLVTTDIGISYKNWAYYSYLDPAFEVNADPDSGFVSIRYYPEENSVSSNFPCLE